MAGVQTPSAEQPRADRMRESVGVLPSLVEPSRGSAEGERLCCARARARSPAAEPRRRKGPRASLALPARAPSSTRSTVVRFARGRGSGVSGLRRVDRTGHATHDGETGGRVQALGSRESGNFGVVLGSGRGWRGLRDADARRPPALWMASGGVGVCTCSLRSHPLGSLRSPQDPEGCPKTCKFSSVMALPLGPGTNEQTLCASGLKIQKVR
jgi:hypothetical protein